MKANMRQAKREYYTTKFQNPKTDPKLAWQTINDILGRNNNQSIIHEIKYSGKSVTSNEELKEIFNEYFTNIGPKLAQTIEHDSACNFEDFFTKRESVNEFSFEAVNELLVYTLIMKLPISKSVGLDKISTKLLQIAAPAITQPLTKIFNTAIDLGQFPLEWKAARVIPIFKKGQRTILDNYRPISILPVVSKLMERILYNQLSKYLEKESILSEYQFGFRSRHSTTTTLIDCTNEWYVNMDRGHYNLVVFLDIKKAFDTVNHDILLKKLEMYGLGDLALALLRSYLTDRTQKCQLQDMLSKQRKITCGIPQGSILGPLLFTLYINDLPNCLKHTTPRMFADDTSLTAAGETLSEVEKRTNEDLRNVHNWLSANKLNLNIAKTEYVLIGSRHRINSLDIQPSINIDKQSVKRVKHSKVLGVQIDEHLAWTKHIEFIAGKISSGIGAIKKAKEFVDRNTLVLIYNALVQPHFDYCCEVWDVLGKTLSDRLQKLQDRAARIIMNFKNESGQSLLARNSLGWTNLEERRVHIKAKLMYKSINNLAPERLSNLFQNSNTIYDYDLRGSSTRLCLPRPKTEFMKKSFSYNGAYVWNHIPEDIRTSASYKSFCQKLSSSTFSCDS